MSEQELVSEIEEVEVAAAEATEESAAIEQQAEEATEAVEVAEAAAEAAEEVDALEEFKSKLRRQMGDWYVVHTYSGYENKVKTGIETRIQNLEALRGSGCVQPGPAAHGRGLRHAPAGLRRAAAEPGPACF